MDMNWKQMWAPVGIAIAIVASTVTITLFITGSQISGLERSLGQLERSQAQQAENILALMNAQNENILALMNAQNEKVLVQLQSLNDRMSNIETEHAELRSLYEKVGELQTEVRYIRRDLDTVRADLDTVRDNQEMMRADIDTMRADIDRILKILETLDGG